MELKTSETSWSSSPTSFATPPERQGLGSTVENRSLDRSISPEENRPLDRSISPARAHPFIFAKICQDLRHPNLSKCPQRCGLLSVPSRPCPSHRRSPAPSRRRHHLVPWL